jgi:hypothetical protein
VAALADTTRPPLLWVALVLNWTCAFKPEWACLRELKKSLPVWVGRQPVVVLVSAHATELRIR